MRGHVLKRGWVEEVAGVRVGGGQGGSFEGLEEGGGGEGDGKARVLVSGERRTGKCNRGWWGGGEGGGIGGGSPATVRTE